MLEKLQGNVFFRRTKIPVSEKTIAILKEEIIESLREIDVLRYEHDRDDTIAFPRTMLKARCTWDCEFAPLCFAELAGMNVSGMIAEQYEKRGSRESEIAESEVD